MGVRLESLGVIFREFGVILGSYWGFGVILGDLGSYSGNLGSN